MDISEAKYEGGWLYLHTASSQEAAQFVFRFKSGEYELKKISRKRSLDANAYAWVLMDKMANKIGISKEEVYRNAIRDIGGNSDIVTVRNDSLEKFLKVWNSKGLGWQTETFPSKVTGCTNVICYYGSSTFSYRQMSKFIDSLVEDAKAIGVQVISERELSLLKVGWNEQEN